MMPAVFANGLRDVSAAGLLDALQVAVGAGRAWAELLSIGPMATVSGEGGPLWLRACPPHDDAMPGRQAGELERFGSNAPVRLQGAGALLYVVGAVDDPTAATGPQQWAAIDTLLGPALRGRWGVPNPLRGPAEPDLTAAVQAASDPDGPFVPLAAALRAPLAGWIELLEQGGWRCLLPDRLPALEARVTIGSIELSHESTRALEPGDLLFPEMADFEHGGLCSLRFGRHRIDGAFEFDDGGSGRFCAVAPAELVPPLGPGGRVAERMVLDCVAGRVRLGLLEALTMAAGDVVPARVGMPHVWLEAGGRRIAAAELMRSDAGLVLEIVRTGWRR